eukprot:jgi/Psemu1/24553/gm1.24553_g
MELDAGTGCYPTGSTGSKGMPMGRLTDKLGERVGYQATSAPLWIDLEAHLLCEATGGSLLEMVWLDTFQQEMPVVPTTTHGILHPCHLCFDG